MASGQVTEVESLSKPDKSIGYIIYALYLAGIACYGITVIVGLIFAYLARRRADVGELLRTHHTFQIRLFWVSLVLWILIGIGMVITMLGVAEGAFGVQPWPVFVMAGFGAVLLIGLYVVTARGFFKLYSGEAMATLVATAQDA
ncbi:MAG: hypothetical protein F4W90_06420 [Gammaproteobacteria bacterium]|nr:hypothetical protein [Gammaproteobacteria bacterium]